MRKYLIAGAILLGLGLVGIGLAGGGDLLMKAFTPEKPAAQGQAIFDGIRKGEFGPLLAATDPALRAQLSPDLLRNMQDAFGKKPVKSVKIVGSNTRMTADTKTYNLTYEYELGDRWMITNIVLAATKGDKTQVEGVHVTPMTRSIEAVNAFTFAGKSVGHVLFLLATIAIATFSIATAVVCWRTAIPRRKWLWRIFVLFSVGSLSLNWTTGELRYQIAEVLLFGAAFSKLFYSPAMLKIGLPLGALIFWWRRCVWMKQASEIEKSRHSRVTN
jgi:hypothetical protein